MVLSGRRGNKVIYNGKELSLSLLAKRLDGNKWKAYQGPKYFTYNDEVLADIRHRLGV